MLNIIFVFLAACSPSEPDSGTGSDTSSPDLVPAELSTLSNGECPDLSTPTTSTFQSDGLERTVTITFPEDRPRGMPVVFFFHGLLDTSYEPTSYFAQALDLQETSDELGVVFVLPQSRTMTFFDYELYMWDVWDDTQPDLVLFDDLRTCLADELGIDTSRLSSSGFSGGSLFVTVLARERGDTLASIVEISGGADIEPTLGIEDTIAEYGTPAYQMPALLFSGGEEDVWPDPSFTIIDFQEATDSLQASLVADGHFVVRCKHDYGHTIPWDALELLQDWTMNNVFGEPSPFAETGISDFGDWCEVINE